MDDNNNEIVELKSFTINSPKALVIDVGCKSVVDAETPLEILPGKYRVFKEIEPDCNDMKSGNMFVLHESIPNKNIPLKNHAWEKGGVFDADSDDYDAVACIFDKDEYNKKFSTKFTNDCVDKLDDKMVEVFDNGVVFSFTQPDNSYVYSIIVENEKIVGFYVDGIGSVMKNQDTRLSNACRRGNFERVKSLLTDPIEENRPNIKFHNYDGFDWACRNAHGDIVKYLISSPDLKEPLNMDLNNGYFFEKLCFKNPEIVESLIFELNIEKTPIMENILNRSKSAPEMKVVENFFKVRELTEKLTFELNTDELIKKSSIKMKV